MTVKTLITRLSRLDPSSRVVVEGYEGGFSDVSKINAIRLNLNVTSPSYYGPYTKHESGEFHAVSITASQTRNK